MKVENMTRGAAAGMRRWPAEAVPEVDLFPAMKMRKVPEKG
jgi:hypothetical protein